MVNKNRIKPERSIELLKELHILSANGGLTQDSNRKLKQIYHLCRFLEPMIDKLSQQGQSMHIVDQWCGKSYLGFMLYDLYLKQLKNKDCVMYGIDNRKDLVNNCISLAQKLWFEGMHFFEETVSWSIWLSTLPKIIDIVIALHACDTATDDAIQFWLSKHAQYIVLVPCCQAEVGTLLTKNKAKSIEQNPLSEMRRHPIHTRAFASHLTNVMRCLWLEANGYTISVTELVWWEHSLKNELIIGTYQDIKNNRSLKRLKYIIEEFGLEEFAQRYYSWW